MESVMKVARSSNQLMKLFLLGIGVIQCDLREPYVRQWSLKLSYRGHADLTHPFIEGLEMLGVAGV